MAKKNQRLDTFAVLAVLATLLASPLAAQEIGEGMSVAEGQPNVITEIAERGEIGNQKISVEDAEGIQAGDDARVVLRSADGEVQQVACLARVRDRDVREADDRDRKYPFIKIQQPLDLRFDEADLVLQGDSSFVAGQGAGVVAKSRIETNRGDEIVLVDDVSRIDPWKRILIRSPENDKEEIRCLRALVGPLGATRDERDDTAPYLTIVGQLDYAYEAEAELVQSSAEGTGEGVVSTLAANAADGSNRPELESLDKLDRFSEVLIRSVDGSDQEVHCIRGVDVENNRIVLSQELGTGFEAGALVVQGPDVAQALVSGEAKERLEGCDCCGPAGAAPLWWLASLAAVPVLIPEDDPPTGDDPALSPIVP